MKSDSFPLRGLRVVVADDSETFRRALRDFLALTMEIEVVAEAADADETIAAVAHTQPALVLMDVRMPGRSGLEVTRHLKAAPNCPWVVLVTMNQTAGLEDAALAVAADGLVQKSRIPERLPALLNALASGAQW